MILLENLVVSLFLKFKEAFFGIFFVVYGGQPIFTWTQRQKPLAWPWVDFDRLTSPTILVFLPPVISLRPIYRIGYKSPKKRGSFYDQSTLLTCYNSAITRIFIYFVCLFPNFFNILYVTSICITASNANNINLNY